MIPTKTQSWRDDYDREEETSQKKPKLSFGEQSNTIFPFITIDLVSSSCNEGTRPLLFNMHSNHERGHISRGK